MPKRPSTGADSVRRAARTLFQVGTITALIQVWNLMSSRPLTADQTSAITVLGTILITFLQNLLEEAGAVPTMLKGPAPAPDLADRKLNALAEATGFHEREIVRLEQALLEIAGRVRRQEPAAQSHPDQPYIGASGTVATPSFTEWDAPIPPPRG